MQRLLRNQLPFALRRPVRAVSKGERFRYKELGLTLLEVLVALVILGVALSAIIKASSENIRATGYLQEKTIATWVGLNILNRAHLQLLQLPPTPDHYDLNENALGQEWECQAFIKATGNAHIPELHVKVFHRQDHRLITELTGYRYGAK